MLDSKARDGNHYPLMYQGAESSQPMPVASEGFNFVASMAFLVNQIDQSSGGTSVSSLVKGCLCLP